MQITESHLLLEVQEVDSGKLFWLLVETDSDAQFRVLAQFRSVNASFVEVLPHGML